MGLMFPTTKSPETTIFDNRYDSDGKRQQLILGVGGELGPHHIPPQWKNADIAYLCPLTGEVDSPIAQCFDRALIGVTPQGWMRGWDKNRRVHAKRWHTAEAILPHADVLILSEEDHRCISRRSGKVYSVDADCCADERAARCSAVRKWSNLGIHCLSCG